MGFEDFFHLKLDPFSNVPDPRFFFSSYEHKLAIVKILYTIDKMRGLSLLVGDVGTGKTTVSRKLLLIINKNPNFKAGLIVLTNNSFKLEWFLGRVAKFLNIDEDYENYEEIKGAIVSKLISYYKDNKKVVLVIDEANNLKERDDIIEEIRGFLNYELGNRKLMNFVLIGTREILPYIKRNESFYQRIAMKLQLKPLSLTSTKEYIKYRLKIAGADVNIFTDDALNIIHEASKGVPRLINIICDNALLDAALQKKLPIDGNMVKDISKLYSIESEI
ncbi:MAG: AAA family ATPase [Proteobacteria bacterium]|nr:AAA family ATPase [Pseudomonadota bacterium]